MRNYLNNDMIVSFLEQTSFPYPNLEDGQTIIREINNPIGFEQYHVFVNNILIPVLKDRYPDNYFIANLRLDKGFNDYGFFYVYKPTMNLIENQEFSDLMLNDFNQIANVLVNDDMLRDYVPSTKNWPLHTIGEYLFLYNLVVNQNALKGSSFNKMFTELIKDSKVIKDYFNYVASNTYDPENSYVKEDFAGLFKEKARNRSGDEFDSVSDFFEDFSDAFDDDFGKPRLPEVSPIINSRSNALSEQASEQVAFEQLLETAILNFKIILKQC